MSDQSFSLCNSCIKSTHDSCAAYRKDPKAICIDCGRFVPDESKTTYAEAIEKVMERKGGSI